MTTPVWDVQFTKPFRASIKEYEDLFKEKYLLAPLSEHATKALEKAARDRVELDEFTRALFWYADNANSLSSLSQVVDIRKIPIKNLYQFKLSRRPWNALFLRVDALSSSERPILSGVFFCHDWDRPADLREALQL